MERFLEETARHLIDSRGQQLQDYCLVLPNRRAALFMEKYMAALVPAPMWAPTFRSVNELMTEISGLRTADHLLLLFELFRTLHGKHPMASQFDDFYSWGELMLRDFDDVDKHRADAGALFTNLSDLKNLDTVFAESPEQEEALRLFRQHFQNSTPGPVRQQHSELWNLLGPLYTEFRDRLCAQGTGYEGMIYRRAADHAEQGTAPALPYPCIVFIGLNAPNPCEEALMQLWQKEGKALFYWDYDPMYLEQPWHQAGFNMRRLIQKFPPALAQPPRRPEGKIVITGVPSATGQAMTACDLLQGWSDNQSWDHTAIVLPDELLLIPLLSVLPEHIRNVNITMGYPLRLTPAYGLVQHLLQLQQNARLQESGNSFFHKDVCNVLTHPYIAPLLPGPAQAWIGAIREQNIIRPAEQMFRENTLSHQIFRACPDTSALAEWLTDTLALIGKTWEGIMQTESETSESPEILDQQEKADTQETRQGPEPTEAHELRQEYLFTAFTHLERLRDLIPAREITIGHKSFASMVLQSLRGVNIPFRGEPLAGLQIMGVLETRALDFDRLIILSMNEGIFPKGNTAPSFIPYNLRKGFGLPTAEYQDAISTYTFYRLLHRAKHVHLLYHSGPPDELHGEASRFITQLRYDPRFTVEEQQTTFSVRTRENQPIVRERTQSMQDTLNQWLSQGPQARTFSPSALNTYLNCPLKFCFRYLDGLREPDEVEEEIDARSFGQLLHKSMELLYTPWVGQTIPADRFQELHKDEDRLRGVLLDAFSKTYFKGQETKAENLTGRNLIVYEVLYQTILRILEVDAQAAPLELIALEHYIKAPVHLELPGRSATLMMGGYVDRMERRKGNLYIIDYKSGKIEYNVNAEFGLNTTGKLNDAALQAITYARLMHQGTPEAPVTPALYGLRELFCSPFEPRLLLDKVLLEDYRTIHEQFAPALDQILSTLFLSGEPFVQTTDVKRCQYCEFREICHR